MQSIIKWLAEFTKNHIFWTALSAWFIAQSIKVALCVMKDKRFQTRSFGENGGMPSSHSASVSALAVSVGLSYGFDSGIFAVALVLAIIVVCDALGIRHIAGKQSELLNKMLEDAYWKQKLGGMKLKKCMGHTPLEVFTGIILGVLVSLLFYRP